MFKINRSCKFILLIVVFSAFSVASAQDVRIIDNKGTIKNLFELSELIDTGVATTTLVPVVFTDIAMTTSTFADAIYTNTPAAGTIQVLEDGRYRVTYRVSTQVPTVVNTRIGGEFHLVNGVTVVPGTKAFTYQRNRTVSNNTVTVVVILDLSANDTLKIQGRIYASTGGGTITLDTVANGSSLLVERL